MHSLHLLLTLLPLSLSTQAPGPSDGDLHIQHTLTHSCERATRKGDTISAHYRGTLLASGTEFDNSYPRGSPLKFSLGAGQVIKGWDMGLLDMCPGDKRVLTIPPELGYGSRSMGPIPAGSTLVFETELMAIEGVQAEKRVVKVVKDGVEAVAGAAGAAGERVGESASSVGQVVGESMASATSVVGEKASSAGEVVGESASSATSIVGEKAGEAASVVGEKVSEATESVKSGAEKAASVVSGAASGAASGAVEGAKQEL